jgi:phage repressor protein C with HTH and peptisase S24 domain
MTASGLARKAGLDATSFNKSKRTSPEGRDRWPSTESISKILQATGASLEDFLRLVEPTASAGQAALPMIATDKAGAITPPEEGQSVDGPEWRRFSFPDLGQDHAFALEVQGNGLAPFYRDGEVLILSAAAPMRKGDRIVVRMAGGDLLVRELKRRSGKTLDVVARPNGDEEQTISLDDVAWAARVMWARQ